jgi:hypothetical protein
VTGGDLRAALDAVLAGKPAFGISSAQHRLQHQMESGKRAGLFLIRQFRELTRIKYS